MVRGCRPWEGVWTRVHQAVSSIICARVVAFLSHLSKSISFQTEKKQKNKKKRKNATKEWKTSQLERLLAVASLSHFNPRQSHLSQLCHGSIRFPNPDTRAGCEEPMNKVAVASFVINIDGPRQRRLDEWELTPPGRVTLLLMNKHSISLRALLWRRETCIAEVLRKYLAF